MQTVNPCKQKIVQMQLPFVPFVCGSRVCRAYFEGGAAISSIALSLTAKAKIHQTLLNAKWLAIIFTSAGTDFLYIYSMLKLFIITLLIVAVCFALISVRLFFGRAFVKTHVDQSKAMRQRGIHCVSTQDAQARAANPHRINETRKND